MTDGFLGFRASLMLDVVVCALVLVVPLLLYSLYVVKVRRNYTLHRNLQMLLGIVLGIAVIAFEIDMRMQGGWEQIVGKREIASDHFEQIRKMLYVHLVFAISTPFLWTATIVLALRRFANPPLPSPHSRLHKKLGWLATIDITLTSVTGLMFYYLAFVK